MSPSLPPLRITARRVWRADRRRFAQFYTIFITFNYRLVGARLLRQTN